MFLPHIVYPALRLILVNRLQKVVNSYEKTLYSVEPSSSQKAWDELSRGKQAVLAEIPLKRIQKKNQICYASAFALRLAKLWQQPALDIANYTAEALNQEKSFPKSRVDSPFDVIWQYCSIYVAPPGWIYLELHKNSVTAWLQIAVNLLPHSPLFADNVTVRSPLTAAKPLRWNASEFSDSTRMFEGLHSYARCTSLLRLAEQADVVRLNPFSDRSSIGWRIVDPSPLPWLQEDGIFRCKRPTEEQLIAQLIDVADALALELAIHDNDSQPQFDQIQLIKAMQGLVQAFQAFHSDCRILGDIKNNDRALAQVRCGLILITQTLLHNLLQAAWGIEPPIEL